MKKYIVVISIVVITCLLVGCEANVNNTINSNERITSQTKTNNHIVIDAISLLDEEYSILKAAGTNNSMVFQISLGNVNVQKINYWIDYYRDGELFETILNMGSQVPELSESREYRLYLTTTGIHSSQEIWTLALRENGNVSSGQYENKINEFDSTMTHPLHEISTGINEITDLGMIIRNNGKDHIALSNDIKSVIKENQEVYVLRCKFD